MRLCGFWPSYAFDTVCLDRRVENMGESANEDRDEKAEPLLAGSYRRYMLGELCMGRTLAPSGRCVGGLGGYVEVDASRSIFPGSSTSFTDRLSRRKCHATRICYAWFILKPSIFRPTPDGSITLDGPPTRSHLKTRHLLL
ncbi:hypothetical protein PMIN04_003709 [Paraphaeosphaeria minitans]